MSGRNEKLVPKGKSAGIRLEKDMQNLFEENLGDGKVLDCT